MRPQMRSALERDLPRRNAALKSPVAAQKVLEGGCLCGAIRYRVSVGGFLGVGTKDVAVKWSDLKIGREAKT
jgi:hypothetical protein